MPPSLAEARPDLPLALSQVIGRALGKLPEARQQSAHELCSEFNAALTSKAAPESAHRSVASHEQITEVMSHDLPPTVWAGEFTAPQPLPKIGQPTIPFTGSTEDNLPTPAFSPATADTVPAKLARPENVINRKWEAIIYFALAGVIIFPLLGVLAWSVIVHEREEWVSSYFPYLFSNVLFSLVFFGL